MKYLPILLCLGLAACHQPGDEAAAPKLSLDAYFTGVAPPSSASIHEIRTTAKPGDLVTISGEIIGRQKPFVDDRAAFVLGDPQKLTTCDKMPMDSESCKTPWDACCATPEHRREGTATVQILGADGRVLKQGLKGSHGLKEASKVAVTGTIDKASTADALVINATALYVSQ